MSLWMDGQSRLDSPIHQNTHTTRHHAPTQTYLPSGAGKSDTVASRKRRPNTSPSATTASQKAITCMGGLGWIGGVGRGCRGGWIPLRFNDQPQRQTCVHTPSTHHPKCPVRLLTRKRSRLMAPASRCATEEWRWKVIGSGWWWADPDAAPLLPLLVCA